ncbi:formate dehydrogenase subunit gamma [Dongia rigui]|uniref:Formate dehydrogenase subunit gamma n=1 Tax=Dongia rigui TaxID=940149 RepID=A0ABU5DY09_9PROT|nr:formate dehydrogenase subunit gamma [Dongia rigui]MDY0872207.1 formate dehydrogenase subunit gamma [Dongia rigui]
MSGLAAARSWDAKAALSIVQEKKSLDGALMPILHALNDAFGYVDATVVPVIADELNLSRAEVHGVLTFYHDFRKAPAGRHVVKVCRAEACQSMAGRDLEEHIKKHLRVELGETTADKRITFEAVYCLGLCACAPSMMVDGKLHGRVTPAKFDKIAGELR